MNALENQALGTSFNNGSFTKLDEINIPISNLAIGRAYAVYEFFRVNQGKAFYLDRHLARFFNSLKILKLEIKYTSEKLENIINQLIELNKRQNFYIKMYAIPEIAANGIKLSSLYILPTEMPKFSTEVYKNGTALLMREYVRFLPEAKSTNYIASEFWKSEMDKIGAIDVLYTNNDEVLECSRGNIFIVKNNIIYTPAENILKGITRSIVFDILIEEKLPFEKMQIATGEMYTSDEVFICSTTKLIVPIIKINETIVGRGKPGKITAMIMEKYNRLLD